MTAADRSPDAMRRATAIGLVAVLCWSSTVGLMRSVSESLGALGGAAIYHGQIEERPVLGEGRPARGTDIPRALSLVRRSIVLWLAVLLTIGVLSA